MVSLSSCFDMPTRSSRRCYDVPQYHQLITSYAKQQGVGLVYFQASNVIADPKTDPLQVNSNGTQVIAAYADILGTR